MDRTENTDTTATGNEPRADESQAAALPAPTAEAEKIPEPTFIHVSVGNMLAALTCASTEESRYYLAGVYVHRTKDGIHLVATDGHRLLIQRDGEAIEGQACDWLDDGVIVSADGLKARLKLLADSRTGDRIKLGFAPGSRHVTLADVADTIRFRVDAVDGQFPDYRTVVKAATGAFVGELDRLRPAAFDTKYIKAVGDLGNALGAKAVMIYQPALASTPEKDGKPATEYHDGPAVVAFTGVPNALLYLMPMRSEAGFSAQQVAILSPAIKASVAALRAHETRNRKAAKGEKDGKAKAALLVAADGYRARVEALLATTRAALPAPSNPVAFNGVAEATPVPAAPEAEAAPVEQAEAAKLADAVEPEAQAPVEPKPEREVERGAKPVRIRLTSRAKMGAARKSRTNGHAQATA